jgi:predicted phage terminase large subunit-like protein
MGVISAERELHAILRQDLPSFIAKVFQTLSPGQQFVRGWPLDAIAYHLELAWLGKIKRLIINMPPRSLKSIAASVAFPLFIHCHDPRRRIICVSYSNELARKHSNDYRSVLETTWYRKLAPHTRVGLKDSEGEIGLTAHGFRLATSTNGTLTGRGGDIIIIDDPLKPADALSESKRTTANHWYTNTLRSRLDDPQNGTIIIVMQRVHIDDLTGYVLSGQEDWEVLSLPAIAESKQEVVVGENTRRMLQPGELIFPERMPEDHLETLRLELGSDVFAAQYQQTPVPPGGAMIKRAWVRQYTDPPAKPLRIFQSWDTALKGGPDNDWSVCTTWAEMWDFRWYLLHVWRERVNYPNLKAKVIELARTWKASQVLIEEAGTAIALLDELKYQVRGLTGIKPDMPKEARMSAVSAKFEAGQVFFPERASWLPELEAELFTFPGGRHDDQVDAISQALRHASASPVGMFARLARTPLVLPRPAQSWWPDPYRPLWF